MRTSSPPTPRAAVVCGAWGGALRGSFFRCGSARVEASGAGPLITAAVFPARPEPPS
jgi:hypothetical protein